MPVNSYTADRIIELYQGFENIRRMADQSGAGDAVPVGMQSVLSGLAWAVGEGATMRSARDTDVIVGRLLPAVLAADAGAAEIRADDLMRLNTGQPLPRPLPQSRFPEKSHAAE